MQHFQNDSPVAENQIEGDKGLSLFLAKMPENIQQSFSEEQLVNIKAALKVAKWKKHRIDLRSSIGFFSYHYYYVFIAGREDREMSRQEQQIKRISYLLFITAFLSFSTLLGILVLYLIKSAMGIDIFPDFSFGIWSWFQGNIYP